MDSFLFIQGQKKGNAIELFDSLFIREITLLVQNSNGDIFYKAPTQKTHGFDLNIGMTNPVGIMVALSSAGVFTAVYKAISIYLNRFNAKELTLTKNDITITIKGHSLPEEKELIQMLAPELLPEKLKKKIK